MDESRTLTLYLDPATLDRARAGRHNFLALVADVAGQAGMRVCYAENTPEAQRASHLSAGWSLFRMEGPVHERALTYRRVYHHPFWQIQPSPRRWEWDVAQAPFRPGQVPRAEADRFAAFWRRRLFGTAGTAHTPDGPVYVALQGRLDEHRSFQSCSPLEMVEAVLEHMPGRPVVAGLHPKESYSNGELRALEALAARHGRLSIRLGGMDDLLPVCACVVTQNSGVGFNGYFLGKPCILFGQSDFHHIALDVTRIGRRAAFERLAHHRPDHAGYLHWIWQRRAINAGRPEAPGRIRDRLRDLGWPV